MNIDAANQRFATFISYGGSSLIMCSDDQFDFEN
jgi:hypothetical protein